MSIHSEKAKELFLSGYNCAQSVFGAFADVVGLDQQQALKIASPFGGGMGRMREVCGAVTGMFLVLGFVDGYSDPKDLAAKQALYQEVQSLAEQFKGRHKTIICRELMNLQKETPSPVPTPRTESFYHNRGCAMYVEDASEILDKFLEEKAIRK